MAAGPTSQLCNIFPLGEDERDEDPEGETEEPRTQLDGRAVMIGIRQ